MNFISLSKRKHILSTYSYYFLILDLYNQNMNIENLMKIIVSIPSLSTEKSYHTIQHVVILDWVRPNFTKVLVHNIN